MKPQTTFAVVLSALTIGVTGAAADPDGSQPQLHGQPAIPDAFDRYLQNNAPQPQPDAFERYLRNNAPQVAPDGNRAAGHPDSLGSRPMVVLEARPLANDRRDWTTGAYGAVGGVLIALLAIAGASAMRERRRVVLR